MKFHFAVLTYLSTLPLLIIGTLSWSTAALGQVEAARIVGTVEDSTGAVVPDARVTITHVATNQQFSATTDETGHYASVPLPIGVFRVTVEAGGFKLTVRDGVQLELGQTGEVNVTLEVGAVTETVNVTAAAPLLVTTEATQGQVIDNHRIVDMPLNGRDYIQLALLSAGAVNPIGGRFGGFSSGGQRTTQNNYMLDGVDNNNLQIAAHARRAEVVKPSIDAIQEFKISTNAYSAEFGRATGGVVNVSIRSGTNDIHGTVFEFLRNEKLDAKNFFDNPDKPKPPFKRNQYGFSVGGPVVKNKTFWFFDYELTKRRESRTSNNTIPTQAQLSGDFSGVSQTIYDPATFDRATKLRQPVPNNTIPRNRIDRVSRQLAAYYPKPTNGKLTQNFLFNAPSQSNNDQLDVRGDHIFGPSDTLFFRYSYQNSDAPGSPSLPAPAYGGSGAVDEANFGQNLALGWTHVFSPNLVSSTKIAWNRIFTDRESKYKQNVAQELGLRGVNQVLLGAPNINISGVSNLGSQNSTPNLVDSQARQLISDTTWTHGKHTFKFGVNLQFLQSSINNPKEALGNFQFNGNFTRQSKSIKGRKRGGRPVADFLLGISRRTRIATFLRFDLRAPWNHAYFQDEWRVTERLTLNLGLRYELNMPWQDRYNRQSNFDLDTDPENPVFVLAKPGSRGQRALVDPDKNNFAPRAGFAYRLTRNTVLRGGYGIFYATNEGTGGGAFLAGNPPFTFRAELSTDSITPAFLLQDGVPEGTLSPTNAKNVQLNSFERDFSTPLSQQWNFNIERQLPHGFLWEIGYFGTKAVHLTHRINSNYALPGPGNINKRRRFTKAQIPGTDTVIKPLARFNRVDYNGNSLYHSFQTKIERRFSNGFTLLGSYIFSRTIGDVSGFAGAGGSPADGTQNPQDLRAERSLDAQHRKQRFVVSAIYDLPFGRGRKFGNNWSGVLNMIAGGWTISSITTFVDGRPFGLSTRGDPANTGDLNRPNVVGDPKLGSSERSLNRFFNTGAFVANDPFTFGNAGRNILIGPATKSEDFAVFKRFPIVEGKFIQFRFETFNITNTPRFGLPNSEVGNNNFGRVTSAGAPRILQFGLKFVF